MTILCRIIVLLNHTIPLSRCEVPIPDRTPVCFLNLEKGKARPVTQSLWWCYFCIRSEDVSRHQIDSSPYWWLRQPGYKSSLPEHSQPTGFTTLQIHNQLDSQPNTSCVWKIGILFSLRYFSDNWLSSLSCTCVCPYVHVYACFWICIWQMNVHVCVYTCGPHWSWLGRGKMCICVFASLILTLQIKMYVWVSA